MEDQDLAADAGQQKQHFTSPAPLTSTSAPPLRRSKKIKNAIQSSHASSGAVKRKRKRPSSADAVSLPAAKSAKTNSKSRRNDLPSQSQGKKARNAESDETSGAASRNSSSIASIPDGEQSFRLFDLPDELWVKIGQMAIDDISEIDFDLYGADYTSAELFADLRTPAILHTCYVLREELRMYYYASQKLQGMLHEDAAFARLMRGYVQAIGPDARRHLREFTMLSYPEHGSADPPDPPHDLSSIWGIELVLEYERGPCDCVGGGCGLDRVDWKVTFK